MAGPQLTYRGPAIAICGGPCHYVRQTLSCGAHHAPFIATKHADALEAACRCIRCFNGLGVAFLAIAKDTDISQTAGCSGSPIVQTGIPRGNIPPTGAEPQSGFCSATGGGGGAEGPLCTHLAVCCGSPEQTYCGPGHRPP